MARESSRKIRKRHPGLIIILLFIILLGTSATIFWFGWCQFALEEGQVAVIHTKIDGYEPEPLIGGQFDWSWHLWRIHALIPKNLTLMIFDTSPREIIIEQTGTLPSGDIYAPIAGEGVNFDWNIKAKVLYSISPQAIAELAAEGHLSDGMEKALESYYTTFETKLTAGLARPLTTTKAHDVGQIENILLQRALDTNPDVRIRAVSLLKWQMPDIELYEETRRIYLDYMKKKQAVMMEIEDQAVRRKDLQGARLDLLERYGKILNDYPALLDFFALEGNPGSVLLPPATLE